MHCNLLPAIPKCALVAKSLKKTQMPVYDTFGPFPDEPLMSSIDRLLFLVGARKLQKRFNLSCPSTDSDRSDYSLNASQMDAYSVITNSKCPKCSKCEIYSTQSENCQETFSKCDVYSTQNENCQEPLSTYYSGRPKITFKKNCSDQEGGQLKRSLRTLKRSFSLCSLACRKLKEKVSFSSSTLPPPSSHWLWTKLQCNVGGCQIYEIFKDSSTTSHPSKFDTRKASKIIFVILPTGTIMPFETIPRH